MAEYLQSWPTYFGLLGKPPKLDASLLEFQTADWTSKFVSWNVISFYAGVLVSLLWVSCFLVSWAMSGFPVTIGLILSLFRDALFQVISSLFWCQLGWFCVVLRQGCCGQAGYLLWALFYVLVFVSRFLATGWTYHWTTLINVLMCVPTFFLALSCFRLSQGAAPAKAKAAKKRALSQKAPQQPQQQPQMPMAFLPSPPQYAFVQPAAPVPTLAPMGQQPQLLVQPAVAQPLYSSQPLPSAARATPLLQASSALPALSVPSATPLAIYPATTAVIARA
eukprot:TRINITY_DN6849_c0_g1_i1.p1 TRINITY_DN6849_c0_g1~~TRINITY_DN6849_c0_g1_i1.p1  ORF type:complete len:278 (-),score=52.31 TRINITY_DN6849_c0_g1_i1:32-865(-)